MRAKSVNQQQGHYRTSISFARQLVVRCCVRLGFYLLVLLVARNRSLGQSPTQQDFSTQKIVSTSALVIVPTSVRTFGGEPVTDLDASHFRLTDNGVEQKVFVESAEKQPIALVVLVEADRAAIDQLHSFRQLDTMLETKFGTAPQKIALVTFSAHVDQIWAFPPNVDALYYVLTHPGYLIADRDDGDATGAAIMDALNTGTGLPQQQPTNYRRIILLLSQSYDSGSKTRFEDLSRRLVESGITIYSLAFSSEVMIGASQRTKNTKSAPAELAMLSGGEEIQFHDENDLERGLMLVSDDISKGYSLSFYIPSSHAALACIPSRFRLSTDRTVCGL